MLTDQAVKLLVGATQTDPSRSKTETSPGVFRGTLRCFCAAVFDEDGDALLDDDGSERLAVLSLPLGVVTAWAGENIEVGGTHYRDATVWVAERDLEHRAVGAERDRDSAAACLAELLDAIAEHEGSRPAAPAQRLREILAATQDKCQNCEHLFAAVQDAGKRSADAWRIADSLGVEQRDDEDTYQWLERSIRESLAAAKARSNARRPRLFTFANGSEIDVDRYLGLDAAATSRTDHGDRPAITFQLGHGGFLRVAFESEQQRADELARLRAFRDGAA